MATGAGAPGPDASGIDAIVGGVPLEVSDGALDVMDLRGEDGLAAETVLALATTKPLLRSVRTICGTLSCVPPTQPPPWIQTTQGDAVEGATLLFQ